MGEDGKKREAVLNCLTGFAALSVLFLRVTIRETPENALERARRRAEQGCSPRQAVDGTARPRGRTRKLAAHMGTGAGTGGGAGPGIGTGTGTGIGNGAGGVAGALGAAVAALYTATLPPALPGGDAGKVPGHGSGRGGDPRPVAAGGQPSAGGGGTKP